ncbi:DJ-1/PfpI family protein [Pseudomonas sp. R1-18]|uniref:DJ-1/PfpI family protein n=1 Tax=Pseudomonas sp. R1-18 TaxID=1632772 RepID=UPI003DAA4AFC
MKKLAIIVPPRRLEFPTLLHCLAAWRKEFNLRIFSLPSVGADNPGFSDILTEDLAELDDGCFDAIAVMDGEGTREYLWDNENIVIQLQRFDNARKLIAGLGYGSIVLAQAGLLVGKEASTADTPEMIIQLKSYGAIFVPKDVVIIKWIVTGSGRDADAFAEAVANWLRQPPR